MCAELHKPGHHCAWPFSVQRDPIPSLSPHPPRVSITNSARPDGHHVKLLTRGARGEGWGAEGGGLAERREVPICSEVYLYST